MNCVLSDKISKTNTIDVSRHKGFILKRNHDPSTIKQLTIREVTASNKHLVPLFRDVNFEFFSLSQSQFIENGDFTREAYHELIQRMATGPEMHGKLADGQIRRVTTYNDDPILNAIVREFGDRQFINLQIINTEIITDDALVGSTGIHFDVARNFALWIPVSTSPIDDLCLGVGDIRRSNLRYRWGTVRTVSEEDLPGITWYQQMRMTPEDWIFFQGWKVPHYALDLSDNLTTQKSLVIRVNLAVDSSNVQMLL